MHPTLKSTLVLLVAAVGLFLLSASGQDNSFWQSGPEWLGSIGWIGFLLSVVLLTVSGVYALVCGCGTATSPHPARTTGTPSSMPARRTPAIAEGGGSARLRSISLPTARGTGRPGVPRRYHVEWTEGLRPAARDVARWADSRSAPTPGARSHP